MYANFQSAQPRLVLNGIIFKYPNKLVLKPNFFEAFRLIKIVNVAFIVKFVFK